MKPQKAYRYDLNGGKLTTLDLVDAFMSAIAGGCSVLFLDHVAGRDETYQFVLHPICVASYGKAIHVEEAQE